MFGNLSPAKRRYKRCYHRVISGFEKDPHVRFLTLTSSPQSINPIQHDFRRLTAYLRRRGVFRDYIRTIEHTSTGFEHVHCLYRGDYIEQSLISGIWAKIHQAPVVDIRAVDRNRLSYSRAAAEIAKYMSKEGHRRYSWSWDWVYKGFVATWRRARGFYSTYCDFSRKSFNFLPFLRLWKAHLRSHSPPAVFLQFLERRSATARVRFYAAAPSSQHCC